MLQKEGLLKPTLQITFFSIVSILVTFITQLVIAYYFGTEFERDAYFAAVAIPTYLSSVFLTLNTLFLPKFIELRIVKGEAEANIFLSNLIIILTLFLAVIIILGILFSKYIVSFTTPSYDEEKILYTSSLLIILFPTILIQSLIYIFSSVYQSENRFVNPALSPIIISCTALLFVIVFHNKIGIRSLAFGTLAGTLVSFVFLIPLIIEKTKHSTSINLKDIHCIELFVLSSPLILTGLIYRSTTVIERMLASSLPTGSISYLGYANQVMATLCSLLTGGFLVTLFPSMAKIWSNNDTEQIKYKLKKGIIIILLMTIPISFVFIFFGRSIFQIIFERGSFNSTATNAVSNVFAVITISFIANSLGGLIPKIFYFAKKTKLLAILEMISLIAYLIPAYLLSRKFSYMGIAIAQSFSGIISISTSTYFVSKIVNGIDERNILYCFLKITLASLFASALAFLVYQFDFMLIIKLGCVLSVFAIVYFYFIFKVFKIAEATELSNRFARSVFKL